VWFPVTREVRTDALKWDSILRLYPFEDWRTAGDARYAILTLDERGSSMMRNDE